MPELSWTEAINTVLRATAEAMHYTDIAEAIIERELRKEVGATPSATVNSIISKSIQVEGNQSPFIRVDRGRYWLRSLAEGKTAPAAQPSAPTVEEAGLINAFGMYWSRSNVLWTNTPRILGQQQPGSDAVDFCTQKGVYLLHDGRAVVYVGRSTDQPLGVRLRQHTIDRLNGRWDRFSWFGVYPVNESGSLKTDAAVAFSLNALIVTMEALLIEGLEPPQNRKRGDEFRAVEFLQAADPDLQKNQVFKLIDELKGKFT